MATGSRWASIVGRLLAGHMAAYPIAFVWALACIPAAIVWSAKEVTTIEDEQRVVSIVLHRLLWPVIAVFVVAHAPSFPWAYAEGDRARRLRRLFLFGDAGFLAVGVVFGGAWWAWLWWWH